MNYDDNDQARFDKETSEEAHYWFTVCDFADLSIEHGIDKLLKDLIEVRRKRLGDL